MADSGHTDGRFVGYRIATPARCNRGMNQLMTHPGEADLAHAARAEALAARLFESIVPAMELMTVELGFRRGLYTGLQKLGDANVAELASECDASRRYLREWLEQQATAGLVDVAIDGDAETRRYTLSPPQAEVLLDAESPFAMAGVSSFLTGMAETFDAVVADFGRGNGVAYADFGASVRHAISSLNRPAFTLALGAWLEQMPDLDERLRTRASVVVDVGCGTGWSTIALARRYPLAHVIGVDLDAASITEAQANAVDAWMGERVRFVVADASHRDVLRAIAGDGAALVTLFEALHDANDPTSVLSSLASILEPDGTILIGDEKVADGFAPNGDLIERLNYGFSVLHCLPATVAEGDGEANGTVMRAPVLARWAEEAGLARPEVLPIDNDLWRFYRIRRR